LKYFLWETERSSPKKKVLRKQKAEENRKQNSFVGKTKPYKEKTGTKSISCVKGKKKANEKGSRIPFHYFNRSPTPFTPPNLYFLTPNSKLCPN
jgi:hypothetical protein